MSFTYKALVCLGKQIAFNFPLEWGYSQAGKRELQGKLIRLIKFQSYFKQVFKTFQENYRNLLNM